MQSASCAVQVVRLPIKLDGGLEGRNQEEYQFDVCLDSGYFYSAKGILLTAMLHFINYPSVHRKNYIWFHNNQECVWKYVSKYLHLQLD